VADRRRRRLSHAAIHATAALGLVVIAVASFAAYRHSTWLTAALVPSMLLLVASHALLAREVRRHEIIERALHDTNRELETFSYSVSHDLRAPLRAIAGFVQILDEDHGATLPADARRHLERVKVNAQRMGQLIDDLLNFSRIGRTLITRQQVDMNAIAATVAQDAVSTAGRDIAIAIDTLPPAYGEPSLLNQVFFNLISNAVKFTARAERPSIKIGSVTQNGELVYCVKDNGVGFDERYAEKLFGVFQRLHRLNDFEGTGVGLAIVERIIRNHGGRIWAEAELDKGATFFFTLAPDH